MSNSNFLYIEEHWRNDCLPKRRKLQNQMTKIILGHTGFIGQSISKIFNNFEKDLIEISRDQIDFLSENSSKALKNIFSRNADVVMCIGIKKQYGDNFENWKKNEIIFHWGQDRT